MKRCIDLLLSLMLTGLLLPVFAVVALIVVLDVGRPVLFRQKRPGLHGRPFVIYKFRTMSDPRDTDGKARQEHERISGIGSFLRRHSLDELPELLNVVRGDMSLVGPRPLLMEYLPLYSAAQMRRHEVRPGLTGWAQVRGRNALSWEDKFRLDVWYVDNRSILLDFRIIALTIAQVVRPSGVNTDSHTTMPPFRGSD